MGIWQFIQDQVLGMKWLNKLIGIALSFLGFDVGDAWEEVFSFSSMTY